MACKIKPRTSLDSLRAVKDGNVRKRTLRPNRVRVQFHDVIITKDKAEDGPRLYLWCARRESNPHDFWSRDFKSLASTYSAIRANTKITWRHVWELHPSTRFCRPLRNCSANAPLHVIIANNLTNHRLLAQIVRFVHVFSKIKTQANARVNILVHWRRLELPRSQ